MNNFLQEFLLLKSTNIDQVLRIVKEVSTPLLALTFSMGAVFEKFSDQNFIGLFKRLIIALFLISFGSTILKSSVQLSFDISARILQSAQKTNPVVQLIDRARKLSQSNLAPKREDGLIEKTKGAASGLWESAAFAAKLLLDDGMSSVVFVISYAALLLLSQFYTIVYNFTYVSIPIIATLIVFPPTYSVANSLTRSMSWVFLMPIFTMITILLLSMSFAFPQDGGQEFYFTSFENLINFCIMALMLLFIPTIVSGFLSGAGVLTAAETFTKTTAMAAASGGKSLLINSARSMGSKVLFGKDYGLMTMSKLGITKGLDKLGTQSMEARKRLNTPVSSPLKTTQGSQTGILNKSQVQTNSSSLRSNTEEAKDTTKASISSRMLDRSIVATDSVLNFKKNHLASKAVREDFKKKSDIPRENRLARFNSYKQNAHREARLMRPIDHRVARLRAEKPFGMRPTEKGLKSGERKSFNSNKFKGNRV